MSPLKYTPEDYKRKLSKLITQSSLKKNKKSKTLHNTYRSPITKIEIDNESFTPSPSTKGLKLKKRKATPYHHKTLKVKPSTKNCKAQINFSTNDDFSDDTSDENKKDVFVEESTEENIWLPSTSSSSTPLNKTKPKVLLKNYSNESSTYEDEDESNSKSLNRILTPYPKKKVRKTVKNKKQRRVSFQPKTDIINNSDEYTSPDTSYQSKSTPKTKKKFVRKDKRTENKYSKNDDGNEICMNVRELICDEKKFKTVLSNNFGFLSSEGSGSEYSSDYGELSLTNFDCSNSLVERYTDTSHQYSNNEIVDENVILEEETCIEPIKENSVERLEISNTFIETCFEDKVDNLDDIEEVGQADYFPLKDALLIVLYNNSKLYFHGLMSVSVLYGVIEVLGYTITVSSEPTEVFSPRGSSFLYFETKEETSLQATLNGFPNVLRDLGMEDEIVNNLCQNLNPNCAVILCREINKPEINFIKRYISQQLFPRCEYKMPQCVFQNKIGSWNVLKPNPKWDLLAKSVECSSRMFLCGGKGVGKSTMLRYVINKLLLKFPNILVIDLDPGQPEFTVPGCISATVINEPVFGPNYTHLKKPHRCIFMPNINVSYEPGNYINNVEELIKSCSKLSKMPVLINYMGFTQGLGLEIFAAAVAYSEPTCIVQIESCIDYKNFKNELGYKLIFDKSKLLAPNIDSLPYFDIVTIRSMTDGNEGWHLLPRQIREMCVLSYLSRALPKDVKSLTDADVPVYVVNMSEIKIMCNDRIVSPAVVNGNFVALCSLEASSKSYTCFGWGVVRAFDLTTNELFLITPLSPDEIKEVDFLILGSVALCASLYMTCDGNTGLVPFVSEGILTSLGKIPKRSYIPQKRK